MPATIDTTSPNGMAPATSKADRVRAFDLDLHPVPTGREEDWRFTPLEPLRPLLEATPGDPLSATWTGEGATVSTVSAGTLTPLLVPADRTSAAAAAATDDVLHVAIGPETTGARVDIDLVGLGGVGSSRVRVDVGRHAHATVVLHHSGSSTASTIVELVAGDGCQVTFVTLHEWADDTVHAAAHAVSVGRDARVQHVLANFGGALQRTTVDVTYAGPGGSAECIGVFFADAGQHLEHRLFVDHAVPNCTSHVEYRGALRGDPRAGDDGVAHTVWIGDVLIRAEATGTSTYEVNRNLLLTDAARADSVPNLEIETGEIVGAGHASTTGRFDDEQLFYLQARGIPEELARRLVVRGFFADLLSRVRVDDVVARIDATLDRELGAIDDGGAGA